MSKTQYTYMASATRDMMRTSEYGSSMHALGARTAPTAKQKQFYNKLYAECKVNGLEGCSHKGTRMGYTYAINNMLMQLHKAGLRKNPPRNVQYQSKRAVSAEPVKLMGGTLW